MSTTQPLDQIIADIECPVLGLFGEADHVISLDDVRRLRDTLERHGKSYTDQGLPRRAAWLAQRHDAGPLPPGAGRGRLGAAARVPRPGARVRLRPVAARCRSTSASMPPTMISARTCGWSNPLLLAIYSCINTL